VSNSLVAFALPDVPRKPLPVSVSKAVAAAAAAGAGCRRWARSRQLSCRRAGRRRWWRRPAVTGCHSVEVVTSQRMKRTRMESMVRSMVARGAQASDAEVETIVAYLAKTLGR
jgi:hypothetical protein